MYRLSSILMTKYSAIMVIVLAMNAGIRFTINCAAIVLAIIAYSVLVQFFVGHFSFALASPAIPSPQVSINIEAMAMSFWYSQTASVLPSMKYSAPFPGNFRKFCWRSAAIINWCIIGILKRLYASRIAIVIASSIANCVLSRISK